MFSQDKKFIRNNNNSTSLFPSRVKNILLNNDSNIFDNNKGWAGLGTIQFIPIYGASNSKNNLFFAKPIFSNIKQYPLKGEIVLIINLPSPIQNENENSSEYYYFNIPISFWNNINHNSFPLEGNSPSLGNTFNEDENINSLLPEEGDLLLEGRFGNSIRFSSTTPNKENNNNSWSNENSKKGSPITIIRNKQKEESTQSPWIPIQEDINNDGSSIWLTSDQTIPINYSCNNLKTLNKTLSDSFDNTLQIPDNSI